MMFVCRICGTELLQPVVMLEQMPLTDDFISVKNLRNKEYLKDIVIFECPKCSFVQNPVDFDYEGYYRDYQYSSGHSYFVQSFMRSYAKLVCNEFYRLNNRYPGAVLEVGSGDGEQLKQFRNLSVPHLIGIEPSEHLARIANKSGIQTLVELFGENVKDKLTDTFDICLSSYTVDHIRNPIDYIKTARALLNDGGILAFEVHDLEKIIERTEFCLFEHEHTIYLTPADVIRLLTSLCFEVTSINPLSNNEARGNSLIGVARKMPMLSSIDYLDKIIQDKPLPNLRLYNLNARIKATIARLDTWIASLSANDDLVGFGAGGRGIMTLAALHNYERFQALFDSNFKSNHYLTPKTRIPVIGPDMWHSFSSAYCLVFSYGYLNEIKEQLVGVGFSPNKILSIANFW